MKRTRLFAAATIIGAAAASLIGAVPASATARRSALAAAHSMPAVAPAGHTPTLPSGARPARPPQAGTRPAGGLRSAAPSDSVACYDGDSILSAANARWVSAELGYTGGNYAMLRARATSIGPWERYALCYDYPCGFCVLDYGGPAP